MVNFRFHLVSLVAVFLALGIGIIVGSTVIDQATVQGLERNVKSLKNQRDTARDEVARLQRWETFDGELPAELLAARLKDVPVALVGVEGINPKLVDKLHEWLSVAGADDRGTLWLTSKLSVAGADERRQLAGLLDVGGARRDAVQRAAVDAIAAALEPPVSEASPTGPPAPPGTVAPTTSTTAPPGTVLAQLRQEGYVAFDPPDGGNVDVATIAKPGLRVIVVSNAQAKVPNGELAVPLVTLLAEQPGSAVAAAEAATDDKARGAFVGAILGNGELRRRVSTVDDAEVGYGQIALVLAVEDLASGVVGHYGVSQNRLLPAPNR